MPKWGHDPSWKRFLMAPQPWVIGMPIKIDRDQSGMLHPRWKRFITAPQPWMNRVPMKISRRWVGSPGGDQLWCMHVQKIEMLIKFDEKHESCLKFDGCVMALGQEVDGGYANRMWRAMAALGGWW